MSKGYWVVQYRSISDESAVKAYAALAGPAIRALGGRPLTTAGSQIEAHEDTYDLARSARQSEAYQNALKALGSGAERDFRIVEGA